MSNPGTPPDKTRFYYPTGIAWLPDPDGGGSGFIYVASSDFDLRFNRGTIAAVDVAALEGSMDAGPQYPDAGVFVPHSDTSFISSIVTIDPFAGPISTFRMPDGTARLFVAGRENNVLQSIDIDGGIGMTCAALDGGTDCFANAVVLATGTFDQLRDAYRPVVTTDGQVFVSGITPIDHPYGSNINFSAALAEVDGRTLGSPSFIQLGAAPAEASDGLAQVGRLLYISGRAFGGDINTTPLRRLNLDDPGATLINSNLTYKSNVLDGRAIAASSDASRLFMVVRDPEALLTLDMTNGADGWPNEQVLNEVELPPGAGELVVISRGIGRGDVVAVTCADDGSVALYDDELGIVEAVVHGLGSQPFGIAAGANPNAPAGARLFVTAFGQGGVAVIELPSLDDLTQARVALTIGADENCLNDDVIARPPSCTVAATKL